MAAQLASQMDGDLIAQAGREIWERRIDDRRRRADGSQVRRRVAAIDRLMNHLEERHLTGEGTLDRVLRHRLYRLHPAARRPLPRQALRARTTVPLHAALLDWQETLL